jgi:hypothetical protein
MPKVYLPLGSQKASGTVGDMVVFQGTSVRSHVVPKDPQTEDQIAVRHLFHDVTKMYKTLGNCERLVCSTYFGSRWFTLIHKRASENGAARYIAAQANFDALTVWQKAIWNAAAPFQQTFGEAGSVFWICVAVLGEYENDVSGGAGYLSDPDPNHPENNLTEWNADVPAALGKGTWDDTNALFQLSGTWNTVSDVNALDGSYKKTDSGYPRSITFFFIGQQVSFYYTAASDLGSLVIVVDGQGLDELNQNSSVTKYGQVFTSPKLSFGLHQFNAQKLAGAAVTFDGVLIVGKKRSTGVPKTTGSTYELGVLELDKQASDPSKPGAGKELLYVKSDGVFYQEDENGVISKVQGSWLTQALADLRYWQLTEHDAHGSLSGLGYDDHSQYHNNTRGDARYVPLTTIKRMLLPFGVYAVISPLSATGAPYMATIDRALTFAKWSQGVYVLTTNNSTNYWTINLYRWSDTALIATFDTKSVTPSTATLITQSSFNIASVLTSGISVYVQCTKNGSPGNLYIAGPALEVTC